MVVPDYEEMVVPDFALGMVVPDFALGMVVSPTLLWEWSCPTLLWEYGRARLDSRGNGRARLWGNGRVLPCCMCA